MKRDEGRGTRGEGKAAGDAGRAAGRIGTAAGHGGRAAGFSPRGQRASHQIRLASRRVCPGGTDRGVLTNKADLPPLTRGGRGRWALRAMLLCIAALVSSIAFSVVAVRAQELTPSRPASQPTSKPTIRFTHLDVYVDAKDQPLAAYQLELAAEKGNVKIVGIEGGEHPAFKKPPYYDPAAMSQDHVIVAAFNTGKDLPKGKTRVARIHVQITGDQKPEYVIKLEVAASAEAQPISGAAATGNEGDSR
jgi:hypothetical protein